MAAAHQLISPNGPLVFTAERLREETELLGTTLLGCFSQGIIEFHSLPGSFVTAISPQPVASAVARYQAQTNASVPNMRHESVPLGDIDRQVIVHLDGEHDHASLFNVLAQLAAEGTVIVQGPEGAPVENEEQRNQQLLDSLNLSMQRLAGAALLVA
jgi:hypothetical protein